MNISHENQGEDIDADYQKRYLIVKLESDRLRKIVICKNCGVREKDTVLSGCYHSFCYTCVDQLINDRM